MKLLFGIPIQYYGLGMSVSSIISLIILVIMVAIYLLVVLCVIHQYIRQNNNNREIRMYENPVAELV